MYLNINLCILSQPSLRQPSKFLVLNTPNNPPTNIVGFRGLDSSMILILRGGILRHIGHFPESLSQAILVGIMLVGRSGVHGTLISLDLRRTEAEAKGSGQSETHIYIYIYI